MAYDSIQSKNNLINNTYYFVEMFEFILIQVDEIANAIYRRQL